MPVPLTPWAKLDAQGNPSLSLVGHALDVAAVFEALVAVPALRRVLARAGGIEDLSPVQVARLTWLVACHDLGKLNRGFQARGHRHLKAETRGHRDEVLGLFHGPLRHRRTLGKQMSVVLRLDEIEAWMELPSPALLYTVWAHHGHLNMPDDTAVAAAWRAEPAYDPVAALQVFIETVTQVFPDAFTSATGQCLPMVPRFQHAFLGLVELADWLGSDPARFPPDAPRAGPERLINSRQWAREALDALRLAGTSPLAAAVARRDIAAVADVPPESTATPVQKAIVDLAAKAPGSGATVILESDTGSGKTEAALLYFAELHRRGLVHGLYFALPTRTSAVQLHARVVEAMRRLFEDRAPPVLLALPGYIRIDEAEGERLPDFRVQWHENREPPGAWAAAHAKRYMAAPVLVGTVDQVLLGTLRQPHAHMRYVPLARLLLVVDEVHASDPYMGALLQAALDRHRALGGHALLMSATLAASAWARHGGRVMPGRVAAAVAPYPRLTASWQEDGPKLGSLDHEKWVRLDLRPHMDDPTSIAAEALTAARAGQMVLVVRNRVDDAVAVQAALEALAGEGAPELFRLNGVSTLHHGRFAAEDRKALDAAVEAIVGKNAPRGQGRIVVGTQTLEQSLDIDADLLLTDLCPMDVLLQRLGRLWRHAWRVRPVAEARVVVLIPSVAADEAAVLAALTPLLRRPAFGLGGYVYPDLRVLAGTWSRLLDGPEIRLPADNRGLVEAALHPERLDALTMAGGDAWLAHACDVAGIALAHQGQARQALLDDDTALDGPTGLATLCAGVDERLTTRLGADDRLVPLDPPLSSPFDVSRQIKEIKIPGWLAKGVPAGGEARAGAGGEFEMPRTAGQSPLRFLYDRYGLRPHPLD